MGINLSRAFERVVTRPGVRRALLGCGAVSSVAYLAADLAASRRYPGYRYRDQAVSELGAEGAPTQGFVIATVGVPFGLLMTAFAGGVLASVGDRGAGRTTAAALAGYALAGFATMIVFPMHPRGSIGSLRNIMHVPVTGIMTLAVLLAMAASTTLLDRRFRRYTVGSMGVMLAYGGITSVHAFNLAVGRPTPWMGAEERVAIYTCLLWTAVFAGTLWRGDQQSDRAAR